MVNADGHPYALSSWVNDCFEVVTLRYDSSRWCNTPGTVNGHCNNLAHYLVDGHNYCRRHAGQKLLDLVLEAAI